MKIVTALTVLVASTGLIACAGSVSLSTRGALVQIAEKDGLHPDCKPIRDVKVKAANQDEAEIVLRNKAGTLAAQKVVIVNRADVPGGIVVEGMAYGCPSGV